MDTCPCFQIIRHFNYNSKIILVKNIKTVQRLLFKIIKKIKNNSNGNTI